MPQLNPEFFASQLFWLVITFVFLFIFLWRVSLPRISSVLEKRENKINNDIKAAKQLQAEAQEIQTKIDQQLREAKSKSDQLIKNALIEFQNHSNNELTKLDSELDEKIEHSSNQIEKKKNDSIKIINDQIYDITKLTLSKISNLKVNDEEIKKTVENIQQQKVH